MARIYMRTLTVLETFGRGGEHHRALSTSSNKLHVILGCEEKENSDSGTGEKISSSFNLSSSFFFPSRHEAELSFTPRKLLILSGVLEVLHYDGKISLVRRMFLLRKVNLFLAGFSFFFLQKFDGKRVFLFDSGEDEFSFLIKLNEDPRRYKVSK